MWAGIIGDRLIDPVRVPEKVNVTTAANCNPPKEVLDPRFSDIALSLLKSFLFIYDHISPTTLGLPKHY